MKKLLILPILLGLTACDRPIAQADLGCDVHVYEKDTVVEYDVSVRLYEDYLTMAIGGGEYKRYPLASEYDSATEKSLVFHDGEYGIGLDLNKEDRYIEDFYFNSRLMKGNSSTGCKVKVPFHTDKYSAPSDVEKCIEIIQGKVFAKDNENLSAGLEVHVSVKKVKSRHDDTVVDWYLEDVDIPADVTKILSKNWDYENPENMKMYSLADGVQPHEADACKVLYRVRSYLAQKGFDKTKIIYADEVGEDKDSTETVSE